MAKPIIVHITADYPDVMEAGKTSAVKNLVEGTSSKYRHIVYSINRVSALGGFASMEFGKDRIALAYGALPKGVMWEKNLPEVARWIRADLQKRNIIPDLIEAHKYTVEGVIGFDLSKSFRCPLICDIQGYTDVNILNKKIALRGIYREMAQHVSAVLPYAPWPIAAFQEAVGLDRAKCTYLPVVPGLDSMQAAPVIEENKMVSVFHLDGWDNKNFEGMALAVRKLVDTHFEAHKALSLDIYGRGSAQTVLTLEKFIRKHDLQDHVRLMGPIENKKMPKMFSDYAAFVLPSKSESYGLVFAEALFSGLPVLCNAHRGISGYFNFDDIGAGCDANSVRSIAVGMSQILLKQEELKAKIAQKQKDGDFDLMLKKNILKTYKDTLDGVLKDAKS